LLEPGAFHELRRSPRVALAIPIALRWEGQRFSGSTLVVNSHGALVHAARNITVGDIFELENVRTRVLCHCRVAWQGGLDRTGFFKLGVEMLEAHPAVWGSDYSMALARSRGSAG
jgi:hypothetical protein